MSAPHYELRLPNGRVTLIDRADYLRVSRFKWSVGQRATAYVAARDGHDKIFLHRFVMGVVDQPGAVVDHINGDRLDNRRSNLRLATVSQNTMNGMPSMPRGSTVYRGVTVTQPGRFVATLVLRAEFVSPEDAARQYDEWAREHRGQWAVLNFPKPGERRHIAAVRDRPPIRKGARA